MKTIELKPQQTLKTVKDEFNQLFPFLKVEFFNKGHEENQGNTINDLLKDESLKLEELGTINDVFEVSLHGNKKVSTLEHEFEAFGINVQVFRKSGDVWLQTTTTDHLTLQEQNEEAMATSK